MSTEVFLLLSILVNVMWLWTSAAPLQPSAAPSPTPAQDGGDLPKSSFQDFSNIHLTTTTSSVDIPIGFHMKLGHNITIATSREVQLGNYSVLIFAAGPVTFEAYNGSFSPPVTGYYQLTAIVHLTLSSVMEGASEVTVHLCLAGRCHDPHAASLEAVTSTQGQQTIHLSGILYLTAGGSDTVVLRAATNNITIATIWRHSSIMAFLLRRIRST